MTSPKIQRWIDLLATLLARRYPATLDDLIAGVPAYQTGNQKKETLRRMFERDKDELRRFGILIRTVEDKEGGPDGYQLSAREFYLPYLSLMVDGRPSRPRRLDKYGYASLPTLSFEPDELDAVAHAAARVRELAKVTEAGTLRVYSNRSEWFGIGNEVSGESTTTQPMGTVTGCLQ